MRPVYGPVLSVVRAAAYGSRLLTLAEVQRAIAFDVVTTGVPRRSCRVFASTSREARILGAVELRVDLERVVIRSEPSTYALSGSGVA